MNKLIENKMNKLILKNIYLASNDLDTLENNNYKITNKWLQKNI